MFRVLVAAFILCVAGTGALAGPCGFDERGRITIKGYGVGQTAIPKDQEARLAAFAETAKYRDGVCIFAQVDKQGTKQANQVVAQKRADAVRAFLTRRGVPADVIRVAKQDEAVTLFGLLSSDQPSDRRVVVTHN